MISAFFAFLSVSALVIVTPGPDTAVTVSATLSGGRRGGVFAALGVSCGQALWTLAASAGVAALLVAGEPIGEALRRGPVRRAIDAITGAVLIGLGVRLATEPH